MYKCFINLIRHCLSEAKLLADVAERNAEKVLSRMMATFQQVLGKNRVAQMINLSSEQRAEKAFKSSYGSNTCTTADGAQ